MNAFRCDRCRKYFDQTNLSDQARRHEAHVHGQKYDLCDSCSKDLSRFVKQSPPVAPETSE